MKELIDNTVPEITIVDLIERSVIENEANVALIFNNQQLTYKELNARTNKTAAFLIAKGVKAGSLVPICLNSSTALITALIAVLKTGAAYVPVDPGYPRDRIKHVLTDCNAKFIITEHLLADKLDALVDAEIIELDDNSINALGLPEQNLANRPLAGSLAYVMYTSGTTGVPNGVMIEHGSVTNNLNWAKNYLKNNKNDVILQKTNFCFDVSVWEIFGALISGAKLVIVDNDDYKNLESLKNIITTHQVTSIHFVPVMLEFFLLSLTKGECCSLKSIISSGEALTPLQANLLRRKIPGATLFNLYGPTETTIHSSYWQVPDSDKEIEKVLIGKPVDHTELFILGEQGEMLPEGMIGEIYIGGRGLARGYLNNPALTAKRFIKSQFTKYKSGLLYRTGDFGRYTGNGNIEYIGRVDDQVKINGYRVELDSIDANIKNSGIVKHAVVLTRKNALQGSQIVAYVVLKTPNSIQDLWDHLVRKLPGYMLPTSILAVQEIPFTVNGKVDKDLLLNIVPGDSWKAEITGPPTATEMKVMLLWKKLFKNDRISIYDNFFDLGGNSITAVKMLSQLERETGKHVSFLLLNQYPTVESLAKLLHKQNLLKIPSVLVPINPGGNKLPLYLVNGGELVEDGFFNLSDVLEKDQPIYSFQSNGYDSNAKRLENMHDIAAFYVKSILNNDNNGPYCIAGYSLGSVIAFEMAKQLKAMGKEVKLLAMIDGLTRDPDIIKTKYSMFTVIKIIALNIYLLKYGVANAIDFTGGLGRAIVRKIKKTYTASPEKTKENNISGDDYHFDVFAQQIAAYKNYKLLPYDGNIIIFRAKRITFYMDDFRYLGWKPYAKKIKSIPINGDHYSIFNYQNIGAFGAKLQAFLNEGF